MVAGSRTGLRFSGIGLYVRGFGLSPTFRKREMWGTQDGRIVNSPQPAFAEQFRWVVAVKFPFGWRRPAHLFCE